jgi:hypothetical protein
VSGTAPPAWYRERPEPEEELVGILRARAAGASPMGRTRLLFELERDSGMPLPIYPPEVEAGLAVLVGRRVHLTGRLVDMTHDDSGLELWVASVNAIRETTDPGG